MKEKYQARRNNSEEEIPVEKTQDEKNIENNENTLKNAAEVAEATGNPYAVAIAKAFKAADKISGGKSTQMLAKGMNTANKIAPGGKQIQNASNKLSESGAGDKIGQAAAMKNNKGASSGGGGKAGIAASNMKIGSSSKGSSGGGLKMVIVGIAAFTVVIFMSIITAVASKDDANLDLTNKTSMSSSSSGSRICTDEEIENKLVYLGDSRIVGLEQTINKDNVTYIAESGMGYNWLVDTARGELDVLLQENPNRIVVLALGANGLGASNYVNYYNQLFSDYPDTTFFVMSVNPVDESKTAANGYTLKNSQIEEFNNEMKNAFPDQYIDSYNGVSEYETGDGVHYNAATNQKVHSYTVNSIKSSNKSLCSGGGDLISKLNDIGNWYVENVTTYTCHTDGNFYNCRTPYDNPFTGRAYGDDCTEFATAYMAYVAGQDISSSFSGGMVDPNGAWAKEVEKLNWKSYTSDEIGSLQPGDVLIAHYGSFYCNKGRHAEIYIDENHTFGWGTIKKSYPTDNTISAREYNGHVLFEDGGHEYITIYRYEG